MHDRTQTLAYLPRWVLFLMVGLKTLRKRVL
jgi:hypothetical protein